MFGGNVKDDYVDIQKMLNKRKIHGVLRGNGVVLHNSLQLLYFCASILDFCIALFKKLFTQRPICIH